MLDSRIEWKLIGDHCQTNHHRESHRQSHCVARLHVPDPRAERAAIIAATALVHGMTIVTRNVTDFEATGAPVFNPWE